jgi:hypothetical protein
MIDLDQNYTVKQVADIWGSSTGTVYNEINDSRLKSKKIRKSRRITGRDLREYAEDCRREMRTLTDSEAGSTASTKFSRYHDHRQDEQSARNHLASDGHRPLRPATSTHCHIIGVDDDANRD